MISKREYEEMLGQKASEESNRRKDRKLQISTAVLTIVLTSAFTLRLEHGSNIIELLRCNT